MNQKTVALCILDGWGLSSNPLGNAVTLADTPYFDSLISTCPNACLTTHGESVGLPADSIGNSEVGHLHIGSGRVIPMPVLEINQSIESGTFNRILPQKSNLHNGSTEIGAIHIIGIVSNIGVHGLGKHLIHSANIYAELGYKVYIHTITDGRDEPPGGAERQIKEIEDSSLENVTIATVSGRYFLMDRDNRWDRVKIGWDAITNGVGKYSDNACEAVQLALQRGETDEFIHPTVVASYKGIRKGDFIFLTNFRADRMRQLSTSFLDPDFNAFATHSKPALSGGLSMVSYFTPPKSWLPSVFEKPTIVNTLGECIARNGLSQARIAETEKFPHVTFFLNGGKEIPEIGEKRFMPNSPKIATYDLAPEMSSVEVTDCFIQAVKTNTNFIVVNIANPDMVGHTGNLQAAIKACEATDRALGRMMKAIHQQGGCMLVIADHGNCEQMIDPETSGVHTAHTTNPVPVILFGRKDVIALQSGSLIDVAPTLLELLEISQPREMNGNSLIKH